MSVRRRTLLLGLFLVTALLAGCASETTDPPAPGRGDDPEGSEGTDGEETSTEVKRGSAVAPDEARLTFLSAIDTIQASEDPGDLPDRFGFSATFSGLGEDGSRTAGSMAFAMDAPANTVVMSIEGDLFDDMGEPDEDPFFPNPFEGATGFLFGQVGKTTFFGGLPGLIGLYNESAEPIEGWDDFKESQERGPEDEEGAEDDEADLSDPFEIFEALEDFPEDATIEAHEATFMGEEALELLISWGEGNGTSTLQAVVFTDPARPAFFEGTFADPTSDDPMERDGTMRIEFTYGHGADHPRLDDLQRLSSLVFLTVDDMNPFGMGAQSEGPKEYTIQPSDHGGTVALDDVTLHVQEDQEDVLTLALEAGSAENEKVRATFEDVDGDGSVSEGDTITVEDLSGEDATYSIALEDEETGLMVVPGLALVLLLALSGLVAVSRRRR